jgi:hypothetical protein
MGLILTTGVLRTGKQITGIEPYLGGGAPYNYVWNTNGTPNFHSLYNLGSSIIGWKFYTTANPGSAVTIIATDTVGTGSLGFSGDPGVGPYTAQSPDYGTRSQGFTLGPGVIVSSYTPPPPPPSRSYRYWKFSVAKIKDGSAEGNANWQIGEFVLKYLGERVDYSTASASTTAGAVYNPSETPSQAIDNDPTTKYCEQPGTGDLSGLGWPLIVDFGKTITANGVSYFTADDTPARDPSDWILWGSTDGTNWDPIQWTQGYIAPTDRYTETETFDFHTAFAHYFHAVPNTGGADSTTFIAWFYPPNADNQGVPIGATAFGINLNNKIGGIYTVTSNILDTYQKITVVGDADSVNPSTTNVGSNEPFEIYWN